MIAEALNWLGRKRKAERAAFTLSAPWLHQHGSVVNNRRRRKLTSIGL